MLQASYAIASNNEATRVHKLVSSIHGITVLLLVGSQHNLMHARTRCTHVRYYNVRLAIVRHSPRKPAVLGCGSAQEPVGFC
jgi:hypothetical protein